ncbi:hypothetical protein DFJ73DRAFT_799421 [Zopfochytrium polystomum]|nr:hypothetical protein DFJ73DRAFT_799421 [Zopfochytrium polystomum]
MAATAPFLLDGKTEKDANTLVYEYLTYGDYKATSEAFRCECQQRGRWPYSSTALSQEAGKVLTAKQEELKNRLLIAFREGDRPTFFSFWDDQFPAAMRVTDAVYQRMEFQISIYFAIFPIHPFVVKAKHSPSLPSAMDTFKHFLETRGAELCKTTQFLSFYALPYVPDPRTHPTFTELFTERHVRELEERLDSFLTSALRVVKPPALLTLLNNRGIAQAETANTQALEIKSLKKQLLEVETGERELLMRHRALQNDYHNLITIASELVQTLAACINGEQITPAYLSTICTRLASFKKGNRRNLETIEERAHVPASGPFSAPSKGAYLRCDYQSTTFSPPPPALDIKNPIPTRDALTTQETADEPATPIVPRGQSSGPATAAATTAAMDFSDLNNLNYDVVRADLMGASGADGARPAAMLLQAVRARISPPASPAERRAAIAAFAQNGLLGRFSETGTNSSDNNLVQHLLEAESPLVREHAARLLNSLAAEAPGREYLLGEDGALVPVLVAGLLGETMDSPAQQNLLSALQRLSLRRSAQSAMIESDVVEFLLDFLEHVATLSEFSLEYGTALFMNLALRTRGRARCAQSDPGRALEILCNLIEMENLQIKTYANGAMYSLLSEPAFREAARAIDLKQILEEVKKSSDAQFTSQIDFIIHQVDSGKTQTTASTKTEETPESDAESEDGFDQDDDDNDASVYFAAFFADDDASSGGGGDDFDGDDLVPEKGELARNALLQARYFRLPPAGAGAFPSARSTGGGLAGSSRGNPPSFAASDAAAVRMSAPSLERVARKAVSSSSSSSSSSAGGPARAAGSGSASPQRLTAAEYESAKRTESLRSSPRKEVRRDINGGGGGGGGSRGNESELEHGFGTRMQLARTPV